MMFNSKIITFYFIPSIYQKLFGESPFDSDVAVDYWMWVFSAILIVIAIVIAFFSRKHLISKSINEFTIANQNIGWQVGLMSIVATWVCSGYLYGTVQGVMTKGSGIVWTQAPWCYSITFMIGAFLFCNRFRQSDHLTFLDPIRDVLGNSISVLLYIPSFLAELTWMSVILTTLGHCMNYVADIPYLWGISIIAFLSCCIPIIGGMYAVAYSGVYLLIVMIISLVILIPFVSTNSLVGDITRTTDIWIGSVQGVQWSSWLDTFIMMCVGGIPWQVCFQHIKASKTTHDAHVIYIYSGIITLFIGIAASIIGILATTVDWSQIPEVGSILGHEGFAFSMIIKHLSGRIGCYFGIALMVTASVSTLSGSLLASSTLFTSVVYQNLLRTNATERELHWVYRLTIPIICFIGLVVSLYTTHVYEIWVMTGELLYVLVLPQLILSIYWPEVINVYGAIAAFIVGVVLRIGAGEEVFGIPKFIPFPEWIPFRTLAACSSVILEVTISLLFHWIVITKRMKSFDFLRFYKSYSLPIHSRVH